MPRKTKEPDEVTNKDTLKATKKSTTAKKSSTKVATKASTKKVTTKKATQQQKPPTTKAKKATQNKTTNKKTATKTTATKKTTTKKATAKKPTTRTKKSTTKKVEIVEYYDLPYRYNQTIVKVLAQTPTNLFIYWDISDKDRQDFQKQYGDNFFENTRPVLIVHNNTLNYSFEVEINDFANSWYLHVADSKCDYKIELGRRPIQKNEKLSSDYIYITTSNDIESPNDRILYDVNQKMVYFRNVKTGQLTGKAINSMSFIKNIGNIYNIYDFYKTIYQNENLEEVYDLKNPSSGNPSSFSFSSKYR